MKQLNCTGFLWWHNSAHDRQRVWSCGVSASTKYHIAHLCILHSLSIFIQNHSRYNIGWSDNKLVTINNNVDSNLLQLQKGASTKPTTVSSHRSGTSLPLSGQSLSLDLAHVLTSQLLKSIQTTCAAFQFFHRGQWYIMRSLVFSVSWDKLIKIIFMSEIR